MFKRVASLFAGTLLAAIGALFLLAGIVMLISVLGSGSTGVSYVMPGLVAALALPFLWSAIKLLRQGPSQVAPDADGLYRTSVWVDESDPLYQAAVSGIDRHVAELSRKRAMKVLDRGYGITDPGAWAEEVEFFLEHVLVPHIRATLPRKAIDRSKRQIAKRLRGRIPSFDESNVVISVLRSLIQDRVNAYEATKPSATIRPGPQMSPGEFEDWCRAQLASAGWNARTTGQSGDQGVDVVATKCERTVVLQCKLYQQPVGNGAVQEIFAGKMMYGAHVAAVVATSGYTSSAQALARKTGVILLSPSELDKLEQTIGL